MGYKKDAIKGISLMGMLRLLTKAVGFFEAVILARILLPSQFGAYGIALLALGLLEVITESGVNIVLVQEKDVDKHINSAWIVSMCRGLLIMLILVLAAPLISDFFNSKESLSLLYLISLVPLIRGFINPAIVKFQKELRFAKDFLFRFTILTIDTVVSIIFTYYTKDPRGIVIGLLAGVFTELILSYVIASPRPTMKFERQYLNSIFHRGKWITASSIFDYLFHNADNIVVGRLLGPSSLGVYQLAYSLSAAPLIEVGRVFVHVTVPIMVNISKEKNRLSSAFYKTVMSISIITFPFAFLFALFPYVAVMLLGDKWAGVSNVLPILAVLGFVKSVSLSANALFLSTNNQKYTTIITFVNILGLVLSIIPLTVSFGMLGAGWAAFIGSICAVPLIIFFVNKIFYELESNRI